MSRKRAYIVSLALIGATLVLQQCKVAKEIVVQEKVAKLSGMEGLREGCSHLDTISNILISKAESIIEIEDQRYEAQVSVFAIKDSLIYISAVNSGFEIIRAFVDYDSIKVIDRINRVIYVSPMERRFGYGHPIGFTDMQNLVSRYFICDDLHTARELDNDKIEFDFDETQQRKRIVFHPESFKVLMFEFVHTKSHKYIVGEATDEGFKIYSNLVIGEVEILTLGGSISFNQDVEVKMGVNPRRYTKINF